MALTDLVPWGRNRSVPAPRYAESGDPFMTLHREVDRIFDDFARSFGSLMPWRAAVSGNWPSVEVSETGEEIKVVAELPGLDQKDVEVSLNDGVLTLKGEKKSENGSALYSERWHGQFVRALQVGADVDPEKVSAQFKNGVLTVTLPKRPEAQRQVKRIPISAG